MGGRAGIFFFWAVMYSVMYYAVSPSTNHSFLAHHSRITTPISSVHEIGEHVCGLVCIFLYYSPFMFNVVLESWK